MNIKTKAKKLAELEWTKEGGISSNYLTVNSFDSLRMNSRGTTYLVRESPMYGIQQRELNEIELTHEEKENIKMNYDLAVARGLINE